MGGGGGLNLYMYVGGALTYRTTINLYLFIVTTKYFLVLYIYSKKIFFCTVYELQNVYLLIFFL